MVFQIGDYTVFQLLGTGSYSKVYRAQHSKMRQDCALKVIDVSTYSEEDLLFLHREIEIVRDLQHPNIIKVYESFVSENYVCISMELCERGTVLEYVNNCGPLHPAEVKALFHQMVSAVQYLHKTCGVIHRDLKCENWMLSSSRSVKLIDFGFARRVIKGELLSTLCGSLHYTAPELIKGEEYTNLIDVWSLGVILYAMASGELPFSGPHPEKAILSEQPNYPLSWSSDLISLLKGMLQKNPAFRLRISDVAKSGYLKEDAFVRPVIRQSISGTDAKIVLPVLVTNSPKKEKARASEPDFQGRRHFVFTSRLHGRVRAFSVDPCADEVRRSSDCSSQTAARSLALLPEFRPKAPSPIVPAHHYL